MRNMLLIIAIVALVFVGSPASADNWNTFVASPTANPTPSNPWMGFDQTTPTEVTVTAAALVNLASHLPGNDYQFMAIQSSSGTVYLGGTVATPTLGVALAAAANPFIVPLSLAPRQSFRANAVAAATCTVKIFGIRAR